MRWAAATDANQAEIMRALRKVGLSVVDLSRVGQGVPDLLVSDGSQMWLVEVKIPGAKMNRRQKDWHLLWKGKPPIIGSSFDEIYRAITKPKRRAG